MMRILGALMILAGLVLFVLYQVVPALICVALGAIFIAKPKKQQEPESSQEEDNNLETVRVDAPLQKVRTSSLNHRRLTFPVEGVTENNDDGSARQQILEALAGGEDLAIAEIWFDDYLFDGKLHIRVVTDQGCIGEIRQKDIKAVRGYFGKSVRMIYSEITHQPLATGTSVFTAEVVIVEEVEEAEAQESRISAEW